MLTMVILCQGCTTKAADVLTPYFEAQAYRPTLTIDAPCPEPSTIIARDKQTVRLPTTLRSGCPGGDGETTGSGGQGGGAVLPISQTKIKVTGSINASGAGSQGANVGPHGGGGGGSGGMIFGDAPLIEITGNVFANGGGGGGGSNSNQSGVDGGQPSNAQTNGKGGNGGGAAWERRRRLAGAAGQPGDNGRGRWWWCWGDQRDRLTERRRRALARPVTRKRWG